MRLAVLLLAACGQTEDPGGSAVSGQADVPWLEAGAPPIAAPDLGWEGLPPVDPPSRTCPPGWVEEPLPAGGHACGPWPGGARLDCADPTTAQRPGTEACAALGSPCPTGAWPDDAGAPGTWYVAVGGAGDGSSGNPFGALADAVAAAADGDTVILGEGTFQAGIVLTRDLTLRGLCASRTTLTWSGGNADGAVVGVDGATVSVSDLRIADSVAAGLTANAATVTLAGVAIEAVGRLGIEAADSALTLDDVRIHGVLPHVDDTLGRGLSLSGGALVVDGLTVDACRQAGVWIEGDTPVTDLRDLVVYDIEPQASDGNRGVGLRTAGDGGDVSVAQMVVEDVHDYAIGGSGSGALHLEDVWVEGILTADDGASFGAVGTQGTGDFFAAGVTVTGVPSTGIKLVPILGSPGGSMYVEDVVVRGVTPDWAQFEGQCFGIVGGNTDSVEIVRAQIDDVSGFGILVDTTTATITDVDVRHARIGLYAGVEGVVRVQDLVAVDNTEAQVLASTVDLELADAYVAAPGAIGATGVFAENPSTIRMVRSLVEDTSIVAFGNPWGVASTLEDVILRDTHGALGSGLGLAVSTTGPASLTRVAVENAEGGAVEVRNGPVTLTDVSIAGVASSATDGQGGFGIFADGADVALERASVTDAAVVGFGCNDCTLIASDLLVSGIAPADCASGGCPKSTAATGLFLGASADGQLDRVVLEGCGVGLQVRGEALASELVLRRNDVGVDAVPGSLDAEHVLFDRNGVDEATTAGPLPGF